jgi:hypothetical protein
MTSPCLQCLQRRPGCHGLCGRYTSYRETVDSLHGLLEAERRRRDIMCEYVHDNRKRVHGNR